MSATATPSPTSQSRAMSKPRPVDSCTGRAGSSPPLRIDGHLHPDYPGLAIVTVAGLVDLTTTGQLRDRIAILFGLGARSVILDLSAVTFMDSTGLSLLTATHKLLRSGRLTASSASPPEDCVTLVGLNDRIRKLLRITGMTRLFPIYRSVDAAVLAHAHRQRDPSDHQDPAQSN
ncbi:STAS domain-containing protein [Actinomadura barringtoniae]|uniref:STAS domain-containing protein n=1 Tax=Actinomadura barringtoniae TaxID=1427535 RepID=A0A939T4S0_9ACTN|nr:STAS domain-containing protein [Actinomadura barringtoniae]MBO2448614.1 STAS domain-containing protein [Actinomadura barringtoniae]